MAKPSIVLNSYSGNVTVKVEKDLDGSMSLRPPPPSSSSQPQQSFTNFCVKDEPQELANEQVPLKMALLPPIPLHEQKQNGNEDEPGAKFMKSVDELGNLSISIQAFKSRFDELQKHLDFIEKAIDTRSKELAEPSNAMQNTYSPSLGANVQNAAPVNLQLTTEKDNKLDSNPKTEVGENELRSLCQMMSSRGLRKYIVSHLSDPVKLREEVPAALKSAPNPSKLVFECIGRFFLQGSRAYTKDSPMIPARQASVLISEYYLMSGCIGNEKQVDPSLKEETSMAAISWKKRLIVEGGVSKACKIDARGLLLFVACFGIPTHFKHDDIRDLVRLSNPREISHALRQSQVLLTKISDIIEGLVKKNLVVEAVDLAYIFGFEEKFSPQTKLTQFLQKSEETWKRTKQETRGSAIVLKEANEKYLSALKSVVKCLEDNKVDATKLLPGWQLKEEIINLEKDITDVNKKIEDKVVQKRKVDKHDSLNKLKIPESKRSRFTGKDLCPVSPSVTVLHEQRIATHIQDGNSSYDDGSLPVYLLDSRLSNNYPTATSVQLGSVAGTLPKNVLGGTVASGGMLGAKASAGMSAGISAATGSFPGYHGDMIIEKVGTMLNSNSQLHRWHGIEEGALANERPVGQSPVAQPASARMNSLYGLSPSIEGFVGLPDHPSIGVANHSGGSDLYSFADAVCEGEPFQGSSSTKAANLPPVLPAHGSSYHY